MLRMLSVLRVYPSAPAPLYTQHCAARAPIADDVARALCGPSCLNPSGRPLFPLHVYAALCTHGPHCATQNSLCFSYGLTHTTHAHTTTKTEQYASSCALPTTWMACPLKSRDKYNHDSFMFEFSLPRGKQMKLPTCACILVRGTDKDGKDAVRPYTPTEETDGGFKLLIKATAARMRTALRARRIRDMEVDGRQADVTYFAACRCNLTLCGMRA